jgi:hypothetical protein
LETFSEGSLYSKSEATSEASTSKKRKRIEGKKKKESMVIFKDVVLLPRPGIRSVPTHQARVTLEVQGFVVHGFPVNKAWNECELKNQLKQLFPGLAATTYEYVKSCYNQIIVARVLSLSGQGCIYLRANEELTTSASACSKDGPMTPIEVSDGERSEVEEFSAIHPTVPTC